MVSQKDEQETFKITHVRRALPIRSSGVLLGYEQAKVEIAVVVKPNSVLCSKHTC